MKTLDKILEELDNTKNTLDDMNHRNSYFLKILENRFENRFRDISMDLSKYKDIIQEQDRIIQSLFKTQANNRDMECMVFVPYRGKPVVIKDGEVVSSDNMTSFDVSWTYDNRTEVTVRRE